MKKIIKFDGKPRKVANSWVITIPMYLLRANKIIKPNNARIIMEVE